VHTHEQATSVLHSQMMSDTVPNKCLSTAHAALLFRDLSVTGIELEREAT